ncbi:MAG: transposase family protein [Candidatus Schekmanbacteria bacterium]|nr:transposase family protein [Candidatus Schekmanbacteria bacterium]
MSKIPDEAIERLGKQLEMLSPRDAQRAALVRQLAESYGCQPVTVWRYLARRNPEPTRRKRCDAERPHHQDHEEFLRWINIVAAIKYASKNRDGAHLSTADAIVRGERGFRDRQTGEWVQLPAGRLKRASVDHWLRKLALNKPAQWESSAVRFGATAPNEFWQFDISVSDAYYLDDNDHLAEDRSWRDAGQRRPRLMLYCVIDDFSRVEFMEYNLGHGEDVETGLRFLFHAMAPKADPSFPFQGVPKALYMDNGPIAKSAVFLRVMKRLGVKIQLHEPPSRAKVRTAARSKGKIERSFRTFHSSFESLFRFHLPSTLREASQYLAAHVLNVAYSKHPLWDEKRIDTWYQNLENIRCLCSWEEFIDLAREPESRLVSNEYRVRYDGESYALNEELAGKHCDLKGKKVEVWKGLFDSGLYVRTADGAIYGPLKPTPLERPLGDFHGRKRVVDGGREKVIELSKRIELPKESLFIDRRSEADQRRRFIVSGAVMRPESATGALYFVNAHLAKGAIIEEFRISLGSLSREQRQEIDALLARTLRRDEVMAQVKEMLDRASGDARQNG